MTSFAAVDWDLLVSAATRGRSRAVADYSDFAVGAAVLTSDGGVFIGCNIENDSFGLTVCAERVAMFNAIANSLHRPTVAAVAVLVDEGALGVPCGACLQVLRRFGPNAFVSYQDAEGQRKVASLNDLLPEPFRM